MAVCEMSMDVSPVLTKHRPPPLPVVADNEVAYKLVNVKA